jgi:type VI secretion system FHA domain protein
MNLNSLRAAGTGRYSEDTMLLTLEVISPNGASLGPNRRKTVGPEGMQIGRAKENDWVIADQYISRVHARIRYVNGAFYVEGLGRNPLAINDANNTFANNDPQLLRSGDRFFLDQFEIKATLSAGNTLAHGEDPFADDSVPTARNSPEVPEIWGGAAPLQGIAIQDGENQEAGNLDPLAALGGSTPRAPAPPKTVDLHQRSVLEDNYQPPRPMVPATEQIPDRWDHSKISHKESSAGRSSAPPAPPPKRPAGAAAGGGVIPDAWDRSGFTHMEQQRSVARPPPPPPQQHQTPPSTAKPAVPQTVRRPAQPPARAEVRKTVAPEPAVVPPPPARSEIPPPSMPQTASLSLESLLRAAGVPAEEMTPEMAAEFGEVFRIVVQGVMEVLQSRSEIKSQLRMSMTRMKPTENNPLKFSPNVEAALHTLLVERNRGYLPTKRAFHEAFADIRDHQIAVLQGIRAAFDAMLEQFDPERIEEEMNRSNSRAGGLLNVGVKSRFRDFYIERFARLTGDRDESFRRLFGEYFAQAYEEQMDRLKATARTSGS